MKLNVLSLNCQKNYKKNLRPFLKKVLERGQYDVFLLQEATEDVLRHFASFPEYKVVNNNDKYRRLSLSCIVYNSKKGNLENFSYEPIFFDSIERQELKKPYQSFGIARAILNFGGIKVGAGCVHLPSGFSKKRRFSYLNSIKKIMKNGDTSLATFFGGDFNFCFKSEVKKALDFMKPEYICCTHDLGPTLDSYYTESRLPYSWVRINDFLRFLNCRIRLRTDQFFLDGNTASKNNLKIRVLPYRVSDHSPLEIALEI